MFRTPPRASLSVARLHASRSLIGVQHRYYTQFINAVNNIGGLTEKQLYQFQLFCQSILASQRHKLNINELEDKYFRPSLLPPIKDDFPILNVTALRHPELIFTRHLADALSLIPTIEAVVAQELQKHSDARSPKDLPLHIVDIGSGGGIPGLAVAIARPNWRVTTVDSVAKKCVFMRHIIDYLGLQNATTVAGRAEALAISGVLSPVIGVTTSFDPSLHDGKMDKYRIFTVPSPEHAIEQKASIQRSKSPLALKDNVYDGATVILSEDGVTPLSTEMKSSSSAVLSQPSTLSSPHDTTATADHRYNVAVGIGELAARALQKPYQPSEQPTHLSLYESAPVVVARGVTNMPDLLGFCAPFVKQNGWFIAQKAAQIHKVLNDDMLGSNDPSQNNLEGSKDVANKENSHSPESPHDIAEVRNKGDQVRLMAKLHASNPHFRDSLMSILRTDYNPLGAASMEYDHISHEIMDARPLLPRHSLSSYTFVNCERFFDHDFHASQSVAQRVMGVPSEDGKTMDSEKPEDVHISEQLRFLAIMRKVHATSSGKIPGKNVRANNHGSEAVSGGVYDGNNSKSSKVSSSSKNASASVQGDGSTKKGLRTPDAVKKKK